MEIIVATKNNGKIKEFEELFKDSNIRFKSLYDINYTDEIVEDGNSFYENALIKAKTIFDKFHIPVLADDSGLCVLALDNQPGIYSARFYNLNTALERRQKVLSLMQGIENRKAYFQCVLVYIDSLGEIHSFEGRIDGEIGYQEEGTNGFGYDPIFYYQGKSLASISDMEKNAISHRGNAIGKFKEYLDELNNK